MQVEARSSRYPSARIAGVVVVGMSVTVLVGWAFDLNTLKRIWPSIPATKANAALMLVVAGAGLAAIARATPTDWQRLCAQAAGVFCLAFSVLSLIEYLWRDLGLDELLFRDTTGSPQPGRPSPFALVGLLLVGTNLILLSRSKTEHSRAAAWINNALAILAMIGIVGYAYDVYYLRHFSRSINGIGVLALVALATLATGLAMLDPRETWLDVFISPGPGGKMVRRFAPLVLLSPVVIGVQTAVYDHPGGRAVAALGVTAAIVITLLTGALALDKAEAERKTLSGLIPICSHCKRIRDDAGYWNQVESYVAQHSEAAFSHSLCPSCLLEHYPNDAEAVIRQLESSGQATSNEDAD